MQMARAASREALEQDFFARLLRSCAHPRDLSEGKRIHSRILETEHQQNRYLGNLLVQMYGKCGNSESARAVFDGIDEPNLFSWSIMIEAYAINGDLGKAKLLFDRMPERDVVAWNTMVAAYAAKNHLDKATGMLEKMPKQNVVSWTAMLLAYAQKRELKEAKRIFDRMPDRNVVSWTTLLQACAQNGCLNEAKIIFEKMPARTVVSWNSMVAAYAQNGHLEEMRSMFEKMPEWDMASWTALTTAYAQRGCLKEARSIFDSMPDRDVVAWNAMVAAYTQHGHLEEARKMFENMPDRNDLSWLSIIQGYAQSGQLVEAKRMLDRMPEKDVASQNAMIAAYAENGDLDQAKSTFDSMSEQDVVSWTAMLAAYAQNGRLQEARSMFDRMIQRDVAAWNAMVASYAHCGKGKESVELFQAMELEGVRPDDVSFMSVLIGCSRVGLLEQGWHYFVSMSADYDIAPTKDHYCCMVDILGRSGRLRDAEDLINSMPFLPDAVAWTTLLGACKTHRDAEFGARAAEQVIQQNPENATPYVLLASIYGALGRHEDMAEVRRAMKDKKVKKVAGMSVIEIENRMHRFVAGDASHPRNDDIHAELQRLSKLMEEAGYRPATEEVLHNVLDEEKEKLLCHHSEKLAIAFGLIATEPGSPLRIVKNLRVCSDCHTATKLISKIVGRQIVVRDASRFHYFENGLCSCQDYW